MLRRLWYWLREVVWVAVIAVALAVVSIALVLLGYAEIAYVVGLSAVVFGLLSIRS